MTYRPITTLIAVVLIASVSLSAYGQMPSARGIGTITWQGEQLSAEERRTAFQRGLLAVLEAHLAETSTPAMRLLADRRDEFLSKADQYAVNAVVLSEDADARSQTYRVVVRADINAALLRSDLFQGAQAVSIRQEPQYMALLFMARSQESVQVFDDRVYAREDVGVTGRTATQSASRITEGERIQRGQIELSDSEESTESVASDVTTTRTTGGSTTQRADRVSWQVANTSAINSAMSGVFSASGYEAIEAEYLEAESGGLLSISAIREGFSTGDDLAPDVMRSTVAGVKQVEIPLLAIGTLDVGLRDTDPVTGNTRVYVMVTGRVLDVTGRFPRTLVSVGPVQFAGLGPNETVARNNALALAAERTAGLIVDQLAVHGVR